MRNGGYILDGYSKKVDIVLFIASKSKTISDKI